MLLTDALSRCPARGSEEIKLDMRVDYVAFNKAWIAKLKEATQEDPITGTVYQLTQQGWPHQRRHTPRMARAYWDFRDELSTDDGLLLKGPHIVIPSCLREEYLERMHYGHLSASKIQDNARQHLYWPRLDADITDFVRRCQECIKKAHSPKEPLQAHDVPSQPWERIAMDHFYQNGRLYLLVCDYFSKFPFIFQTKSTSFAYIKEQLEELFGLEGAPDEIMSDNGPPFSSREFNSFLSGLGIKHTTSSPNYPQSNGFIERQIQTVKRLMEKATATGRSFQEALTGLRATPIAEGMPSPAEILHGRSLTTRKAISVDLNAIRQHLIQLQAKYIKQHDKARRARSQRALVIGEEVYHLSVGNNWVIGIITGTRDSGRSYDVLTEGGTSLRRNRSHLKPRSHDIPVLNQAFISGPCTPSQSEISNLSISGPAHPPKEKYTGRTTHNNRFSNISGPAHPPKEKYSLSQPQSVPKLIIRRYGDTAYDSYIAETMVPLRSAFRPRKQTRFESDPVTSVRHIPAKSSNTQPTPSRTLDPLDPDLLIPIELSQAAQGNSVQDLGESEAGEANDTSIAHTPPPPPPHHVAKSKLEGVTTAPVTALLISGPIHPPKEKYSLTGPVHPPKVKYSLQTKYSLQNQVTITVSGPIHPPKVKYSQKLQMLHIPATQRQVRVQTSVRSIPHPPRPPARQPAVPTAQTLPGPQHPPKEKYSLKQQQSTMQAVRQVPVNLQDLPPQSLVI